MTRRNLSATNYDETKPQWPLRSPGDVCGHCASWVWISTDCIMRTNSFYPLFLFFQHERTPHLQIISPDLSVTVSVTLQRRGVRGSVHWGCDCATALNFEVDPQRRRLVRLCSSNYDGRPRGDATWVLCTRGGHIGSSRCNQVCYLPLGIHDNVLGMYRNCAVSAARVFAQKDLSEGEINSSQPKSRLCYEGVERERDTQE